MAVDAVHSNAVDGVAVDSDTTGGGKVSGGGYIRGTISSFGKVAKLSPGEI